MFDNILKGIKGLKDEAHSDLKIWSDNKKSDGKTWDKYSDLCKSLYERMQEKKTKYIIKFKDEVVETLTESLWLENTEFLRGKDIRKNFFFGCAMYAIDSIKEDFKKFINDEGYGKDDCRQITIICECGSGIFKPIYDCSFPESTAQWYQCCNCDRKYDVRINLITQEYIKEIEE
jgi:hypothetical protein